MSKNMKTKDLAFFGAFNPPTKAHVELAQYAMMKCGYRTVLFVPSQASYITGEQRKSFAFSDVERALMLHSLETRYHIGVCTWELIQDEQPRTYDTLKHIQSYYGNPHALLVGSDVFERMSTEWLNVPQIAEEFGIVVMTRQESKANLKRLLTDDSFYRKIAPHVRIIETPKRFHDISSTDIRNYISNIQQQISAIRDALPESVYQFVKEKYIHAI